MYKSSKDRSRSRSSTQNGTNDHDTKQDTKNDKDEEYTTPAESRNQHSDKKKKYKFGKLIVLQNNKKAKQFLMWS